MQRAYEIIDDAHKIIGNDTDHSEFIDLVVITLDDMHDGRPIVGLHHNGKIVQYLLTNKEYRNLEKIKRDNGLK